MNPALEYLLARLLADYLIHLQETEFLPEELQIVIGLEMAARQRPCIVCHVEAVEFPHPRLAEAEMTVTLHTHADETPVLTEALWIAQLRSALSDQVAFFSWLANLPSQDRQGWTLRRLRLSRSESDLNREERTRSHTTRLSLSAQSDELTPAA
jgi:hypothetical protein